MEKLTQQEEQAMQALWQIGKGNIKAIMQAMPEASIPYTTVASTIKNLERKHFVSSEIFGNAYLYTPIVPESSYKKEFMKGFIAEYFENSFKELVTFFAKEKNISADDLKEIIQLIEKG